MRKEQPKVQTVRWTSTWGRQLQEYKPAEYAFLKRVTAQMRRGVVAVACRAVVVAVAASLLVVEAWAHCWLEQRALWSLFRSPSRVDSVEAIEQHRRLARVVHAHTCIECKHDRNCVGCRRHRTSQRRSQPSFRTAARFLLQRRHLDSRRSPPLPPRQSRCPTQHFAQHYHWPPDSGRRRRPEHWHNAGTGRHLLETHQSSFRCLATPVRWDPQANSRNLPPKEQPRQPRSISIEASRS